MSIQKCFVNFVFVFYRRDYHIKEKVVKAKEASMVRAPKESPRAKARNNRLRAYAGRSSRHERPWPFPKKSVLAGPY